MGQQPNIELKLADLPRSKPDPGPARRWRPQRPGEIDSPEDLPSGGAFGVVGPDAGYALRLVASRDLKLLPGEHHHDAAAAVAAIATARAAREGRAPVASDVTAGMIVLGLDGSTAVDGAVLAERRGWIANVAHDAGKLRRLVADIAVEVLQLPVDQLRERIEAGWSLRGPMQ